MTDIASHYDLMVFQTNIAERWLHRGRSTHDPFARFLFFFAGFNALYFFWKVADGVVGGETKQIAALVAKLPEEQALALLSEVDDDVRYFAVDRGRPIERMDIRSGAGVGDPAEGRRHQKVLQNSTEARARLNALAQIIYLVRSNLAHGSKAESGDDEDVVQHALRPLELLLERSLRITLG